MADKTWKMPADDAPDAPPPTDTGVHGTRRIAADGPATGPHGTLRMDAAAPAAPNAAPEHAFGVLAPGARLCDSYTVEETLQPHERLLPGVYRCTTDDGARVIVKIAPLQYPPRLEMWKRLATLRHPNVLQTYCTLEQDGLFYEVQDYCDAGTLDDYVPRAEGGKPFPVEAIMDGLARHLHEGLEYLHGQGIVHRDLKPKNIYLKTAKGGRITAVLADFDISSILDRTRTSRMTDRAGGTWIYAAPEAFPRFMDETGRVGAQVSYASDYYALGVTLIELLVGVTSLHTCKLSDLYDFYLQGNKIAIPEKIPARLGQLLRGLLIRNRKTRWGAEALHRWLAQTNTPEDLAAIAEDERFTFTRAARPYKLQEQTAYDLPGLAHAMAYAQGIALDDLMSGDILLQWIAEQDSNIARAIRHDREALRETPALVLWSAILHCAPDQPYCTQEGHEAHSLEDWFDYAAQQVAQGTVTREQLCGDLELRKLALWLRIKDNPEPDQAAALEGILASPPLIRLEEIAYHLHQEQPFFIMRGVSAPTPREFVALVYGQPEAWSAGMPAVYQAAFKRWQDGSLTAWLRQHGLAPLAAQGTELLKRFADHPYAAFETLLRLLDPALPPVQVTVDTAVLGSFHYINYGSYREFQLPYYTRGGGIPFGTFIAADQPPGVTVNNTLVDRRRGTVTVRVDTAETETGNSPRRLELAFDSALAALVPATLEFRYQIEFPTTTAGRYIGVGALVGAAAFGLVRLIPGIIDARTPREIMATGLELNATTLNGDTPGYVVFCLAYLALIVGGYFFWRSAILLPEERAGQRAAMHGALDFGAAQPGRIIGPIISAIVFMFPCVSCVGALLSLPGIVIAGLGDTFVSVGYAIPLPMPLLWALNGAALGASLGAWHILPFYEARRQRPLLFLPQYLLFLATLLHFTYQATQAMSPR